MIGPYEDMHAQKNTHIETACSSERSTVCRRLANEQELSWLEQARDTHMGRSMVQQVLIAISAFVSGEKVDLR
jgi:hypothetical protein